MSRRIVVALDASPGSRAACEAAVELARSLEADLLGLFVEEERLLRLADLPFARQVGTTSGSVRPIGPDEIGSQLRALARRARESLARAAAPASVGWTFRVARGSIADQLAAAASGADLVTLGRAGWSMAGRRHVGSTVRALVEAGSQRVLVLPGKPPAGPVRALLDVAAAAREVLGSAVELALAWARPLEVVVPGLDPALASRLAGEARSLPGARSLDVRVRPADGPVAGRCGLFVLAAASPLLAGDSIAPLLAGTDAPVLVVGAAPESHPGPAE